MMFANIVILSTQNLQPCHLFCRNKITQPTRNVALNKESSACVDGGLIGGSSVRRPGRELFKTPEGVVVGFLTNKNIRMPINPNPRTMTLLGGQGGTFKSCHRIPKFCMGS